MGNEALRKEIAIMERELNIRRLHLRKEELGEEIIKIEESIRSQTEQLTEMRGG